MSKPVYRITATICGRVQGVGFRNWAVAEVASNRLPITGTVRNLPDGNVEVIAESPNRAALEKLLALLKGGPSLSHVDSVDALYETVVAARFAEFRSVQ